MTIEHHIHHKLKLSQVKYALILTSIGMILEFAGGMLSHSLALVSDAWHMVTHLFALGMSYFAIILSLRPASKKHTYGFFRAEILAAFINGIILIFVSAYLVYEAAMRFVKPVEIRTFEMFVIAFIGLIINGTTIFLLLKAGSSDLNIKSAILHEMSDTVSSVAVVTGAFFILYSKNYWVDSVLTFFITLLIVIWSIKLLNDSAHILLEATPSHMDIDVVIDALKSEIPHIREVHHVHAWTIASNMYALTAHVVIEDCSISSANELLRKINVLLREKFNIGHTNIQFECLVKKSV